MRRILCLLLILPVMATLLAGCVAAGKALPSDGHAEETLPAGEASPVGTAQSTVPADFYDANRQFALDLFKQLNKEDKHKNIFISPLSVSTALSMAWQGAGGSTADAMAKALGYDRLSTANVRESYKSLLAHLQQVDEKIELDIGNSIWLRKGTAVKEDFLTASQDYFAAKASPLDFSNAGAADEINKWIASTTRGKIKKMINSPIPENIAMYLINAIYFKGQWTDAFNSKQTREAQFHTGSGKTKNVMMMNRKGKTEYGAGDGFKAVRLPYGNGKTSMYVILPDKGASVNKFVEALTPDKWNEIKDSIHENETITLQLPRFKLEYGVKELQKSLTALGMGAAFTDSADFSGIRENICISKVIHKAVIDVNEEGSEAAGATGVEIQLTSAPATPPPEFIADRPFVFAITDDETGTILFLGKLYDIE